MKTKSFFSIVTNFLVFTIFVFLFFCSASSQAQTSDRKGKRQNMLFLADSGILTKSDYLFKLEKVFEAVNKVPVTIASFTKLTPIIGHLNQDETVLALLKERLSQSERTSNLQNLQMYQQLLDQLESNNEDCLKDLEKYDERLSAVKSGFLSFRKDTVLRQIFTTDSLRSAFSTQLRELGKKRIIMDSLVKSNTDLINTLQSRTAANIINIKELIYLTESQLKSVGLKAIGKERRYLWEQTDRISNRGLGFRRFMQSEQQVSQYYFTYTRSSRLMLLFSGILFFFWIMLNFRSLKRRNKLNIADDFKFAFIKPYPYLPALIFIFTLAPVFDLQAPALYIESVQLLIAASLSVLFFRQLPRPLFYNWCIFVLLLLSPVILRILGISPRYQRWLQFVLSIAAFAYGLIAYRKLAAKAKQHRLRVLLVVGYIFIFYSLSAIICNLFGRVTLTQIFYTTAVSSFLYIVALIVFSRMLNEAFLLQIISSRVRKNYPEHFDWKPVAGKMQQLINLAAIIIWLVMFTVNLNIFDSIYELIVNVLSVPRTIGSFSFTLGGIVLFLGIIWTANFLQKYIAYFLGDMGDDSLDDNKGERSRLLVTRLILLIVGFLIAVAASGLPIDKITVILGALGVGIGLGLQDIVSNFVSGVILIFDRTLRIGDIVELSDKKGRVKEIGIRASTLLSDEGAEIIIPNGSILSNNIINWTLSNTHMRISIEFIVGKPFDAAEVIKLIKEIIRSDANVVLNKEPKIIINQVSTTSCSIMIYFWCKDISQAENTKSQVNALLFDTLEQKGVKLL